MVEDESSPVRTRGNRGFIRNAGAGLGAGLGALGEDVLGGIAKGIANGFVNLVNAFGR